MDVVSPLQSQTCRSSGNSSQISCIPQDRLVLAHGLMLPNVDEFGTFWNVCRISKPVFIFCRCVCYCFWYFCFCFWASRFGCEVLADYSSFLLLHLSATAAQFLAICFGCCRAAAATDLDVAVLGLTPLKCESMMYRSEALGRRIERKDERLPDSVASSLSIVAMLHWSVALLVFQDIVGSSSL